VEVRGNLARVRTLWDRLSRVAAYDQRSRVAGIISWESGPDLLLTYIQHQADIQAGDTVISSGWGEVFPKGLRIGKVDSVEVRPGEPFLRVKVCAVVEPGILEHVFVIEPRAPAEQDSLMGGSLP
jgi:rod shape-determining protein MreC